MTIRYTGKEGVRRLLFLLFLFPILNVVAQETASPVSHSVFLVGDAGEPYAGDGPFGTVLRQHVGEAQKATVLYLGDNVYPSGLPEPGGRYRQTGEKILRTQVEWIQGLNAKGIFIPGNHDWDHWGKNGLRYIIQQRQWIDSLRDENFSFLPEDGCPGPVEVPLDSDLLLVILDTQWFLHQWDKPGEGGPCEANTTAEVLAMLEDVLQRNAGKRVIIAGHHPLVTYGEHGGVFTWKDHLFPLTDINPNLYIPLPVIGSFYPLYRKLFGHIQDTVHPVYREFRKPMEALLKDHSGSIYVSGHEHALQYSVKDSTHHIVSGSGAKVTHVKKKGYAKFAKGVRGFAKLSIHEDGSVSVHFIQADETFPMGKEIFTTTLK